MRAVRTKTAESGLLSVVKENVSSWVCRERTLAKATVMAGFHSSSSFRCGWSLLVSKDTGGQCICHDSYMPQALVPLFSQI